MLKRTLLTVVSLWAVLALGLSCAPAAAPKGETGALGAPTLSTKLAEQAKAGGLLKHAAAGDEGTFDLHVTGRNLPSEQVGPAYSGLLQYDPTDGRKIITDLAESYQIGPDGKKVTFALRKNVKWHDGKPFTSEDVKFNFDRWMKPPEGVSITRREIVAAAERVETPNANTVDVYLKYPSPFFIAGIAIGSAAAIFPPQHLKDHKTMEYNVLGTGPFKLKEYKRGVSIEFVKNQDYFIADRPFLDGMIQYIMPDETARFSAFRTGQVRTMCMFSTNVTPAHAELLRKEMSDKVKVASMPGLAPGLVYLNASQSPFNDVRVRQAVDMVIDRSKMQDVIETRGEPGGPMPKGPWALPDDELSKRPGYGGVTPKDIEKAKALLAEAGFPKGFQADAPIANTYPKQMVFIQDQLKAIGIDVSIKVLDTATMEKRYIAHDFGISFYPSTQPVDDPDLYLSYYVTGGGRNYGLFSDKQIDDWYEQQSRTMDAGKRKELVLNIQRRVIDLAAAPTLYHSLYETPYWQCVKGYYPEKSLGGHHNVKRQDIWLDDACRQ